ncbi:MAG: flagellar basal-body rod protein FlgF [Brevundimonas sp.]|uniref:Flagellar basal-body rod protein FlgF n=1 Tax=Brevundimonas mediterranea TaxID=74329 RepID=A0A7W6EZX7_9CAUL|nr:flagellar basal-body rod protein FlgF [Brevundimonas sp.]MBB3871857.1 flagellar basal-body rod protein FlgF [Brevundimonas mediterranea]MDK2748767.1 flagellar basal-body rod protein FlgF [Brevundimonas sp.]
MENAAYIGLSRQMTLRRELDIVANNVANADTTGFKVEQLMVGTEVGQRARNDSIRPSASFVLDNGVGRDFGQGSMSETGRPLDFAIAGEGAFFTVRDGAAGEAYTRDGAFTMDPEGRLTTKQGQAVLGGGAEIVLDPALGVPSVGADGTITQNGQITGRLSVVRFDTLGVLEKGGDGLYRNGSNVQPVEANDVQIHQGSLEASNVNSLTEITNLIEISRAYESITRMIENTNDLSRRAVERLGKAA